MLGLVINGAVQPFGGLGSVAAFSSRGVPSSYMGVFGTRMGWKYDRTGNAALRSLCQGELIPRVGAPSAFAPANTCGIDGSMACTYGSPQSALGGLGNFGAVSNFICSDWASIMTQMQILLAQAEERGVSTAAYAAARQYFDENTGPFQKPILTCASHTERAKALYNALNSELGFTAPSVSSTLDPNDPTSPNYKPPGENAQIAAAVKWGAIAVACLAGAYALGPLFRGVGGLIPRRGR